MCVVLWMWWVDVEVVALLWCCCSGCCVFVFVGVHGPFDPLTEFLQMPQAKPTCKWWAP